jgi:long-chain acyl-CoA synthetase
MPVAKMEEAEKRFGCPLIELWGMTELAGLGTTFPCHGPHKLGSIGIALPHVEARIADVSDASKTMPTGRGWRINDTRSDRHAGLLWK